MSRVYFGVTRDDLVQLFETSQLSVQTCEHFRAYTVTMQWAEIQSEKDPEILADELLQIVAEHSNPFIVVAELSQHGFEILDPDLGLVRVTSAIAAKQIEALFQRDADGELLWFGPSELESLLESTA